MAKQLSQETLDTFCRPGSRRCRYCGYRVRSDKHEQGNHHGDIIKKQKGAPNG